MDHQADYHFTPKGDLVVSVYPSHTRDKSRDWGLQPYQSSRITHAGYDEQSMLCFLAYPPTKTGPATVYEYRGVEPDVWDGFLEAESKGSYLAQIVGKRGEPAPYPYRKLDPVVEADATADPTPAVGVEEAPTAAIGAASNADTISELPDDDKALMPFAQGFLARVRQFFIKTPDDYQTADNQLVLLKAQRALVTARMNLVYDPAFNTYKEALKLKQDALAPFDEAENLFKSRMITYRQEEERTRRKLEQEEQRHLQALADQQAKEQAALEAEQAAKHYEAQGEPELAESVRANPLPVAPVTVGPVVMEAAVPKGKTTLKENWQYRIVNADAIPLTHEFYTLDERKINAKVKLLKSNHGIPGVEAYDAGTIATR